MTEAIALTPLLRRIRHGSLIVGLLSGCICAAGYGLHRADFLHAYLVSYLYWTGVTLGCMCLLMIHHLTGGAWGLAIRRVLESALAPLPLLVLLFVPIVCGLPELYSWARPDAFTVDPVLQLKRAYLNPDAFTIRAAAYFFIWILLAGALVGWSRNGTAAEEARRKTWLIRVSGPGLILYGFSTTFAAIDWGMSIEPKWYSSMYGILFMAGQALIGLAFAVVVLAMVDRRRDPAPRVAPSCWHDLGNLLLTFVMFWAYVAYMQFLIIWSGNLPEEVVWYVRRTAGGWQWVAIALIVLHFFVPFFLLLSRDIKRHGGLLGYVALLILIVRALDLCWLITPAYAPALHFNLWSIASMLGVGGLWAAVFTRSLAARLAMPIFDPNYEGVFHEQPSHAGTELA